MDLDGRVSTTVFSLAPISVVVCTKGDEDLEQGRREALASVERTKSARALRYASQARVILPETVPSTDNTPVSVVTSLQRYHRPPDLHLAPPVSRSHSEYVNASLKHLPTAQRISIFLF